MKNNTDSIQDKEINVESNEVAEKKDVKKKKLPKPVRVFLITLCSVLALGAVTYLCVYLYVRSRVKYNDFQNEEKKEENFEEEWEDTDGKAKTQEEVKIDPDSIKSNDTYDPNVINILLVGADGMSTDKDRGRSDTIMIATINKNDKAIRLTSILRDIYVPIEGYSDNKINASYRLGGVSLLKDTIEKNFKIDISYCVRVNFDTYQDIIEKLGGVDNINVNKGEADFINVRLKKSPKVVPGESVHLNAEQAFWFSRIRYVSSEVYGRYDFGRTKRQRTVLNEIYRKYKDLSTTEMISLMDSLLGYIETDMTADEIINCAVLVLSYKNDNISEFKIPMDGCYSNDSVKTTSGKRMSVIGIKDYYKQNVEGLHQFIYGTTEGLE